MKKTCIIRGSFLSLLIVLCLTAAACTSSDNAQAVAETAQTIAQATETSLETTSATEPETPSEAGTEAALVDSTSGDTLTFRQIGEEQSVALEPAPDGDIFWSSDDLSVAMVADGKIVAVGEGTTTVHAYYDDGEAAWEIVSQPDPTLKAKTISKTYYQQPLERPPKVTEDLTEYFSDVIIMGDSTGYMLYQWNNLYHELDDALFMTRGGVSINSLVIGSRKYFYNRKELRAEDAVAACGRKKLYVMLGANDIPQFGIEKTMLLWDSLLGKIQEKTPDIEIYIQSLTPVWTPAEYEGFTNEIIDEYNVVLEAYCQENGYHYVGIAHYFKDATNGLARAYCSDDFVHTSYRGSEVWAQCLKEYALTTLEK